MERKRGANGGGTIRQRKDGRWEARYTVGYNPGTGKQMQKSVYGNTQNEVRKKLNEAVNQIDKGSYIEPSKYRLDEWLDVWLADFTGGIKPYTLDSYARNIKNHIKPALGYTKLTGLNAVLIQQFINNLSTSKDEGGKGLSAKTVKNIVGTLQSAISQAVQLGIMQTNPVGVCQLPRGEKAEMRPLRDDEVERFLKAINGHRLETLFTVVLFTGMRQGEALGLGWDSVDFNGGSIHIKRQLQQRQVKGDFGYYFAPLKNDKPRTIVPAPFVMQKLKEHRDAQAALPAHALGVWDTENNLVFTDELGQCLSRRTTYGIFKSVVTEIGLPDVRFHDLRHTFATMSLQSGVDIKTLSETLGHHSVAFTLDVYSESTNRMKQEAANKMESFAKRMIEI